MIVRGQSFCGALRNWRFIARPFPKALPASDCQGNNSATANQCNLSHHRGTCSWLPLASLSPCELCRIEKYVEPQAVWRTWKKDRQDGRVEANLFPKYSIWVMGYCSRWEVFIRPASSSYVSNHLSLNIGDQISFCRDHSLAKDGHAPSLKSGVGV